MNNPVQKSYVSRVPHVITAMYWIIKICATTLGETGADLFSMTMNEGYALTTLLFMGIFIITLFIQMKSKMYNPVKYWMVFTATSIVGTTISDLMDRTLGFGYALGTIIILCALFSILFLWKRLEGSLSVTNIKSERGEILYWIAFLVANTLGTALGDFLADSSGLGFGGGAVLISSLLALTLLTHYITKIPGVILFWIAFVLTRPFGATFGDLLTKTTNKGGLGFGTIGSSAVLGAILFIVVGISYFQIVKVRQKQ